MVSEGVVKCFQVTMDSVAHGVRAVRVVQPAELIQTVSLSCTLAQIAPGGMRESLMAKARAAADAFARGNKKAARGSLQAFLNELKAQGGKHVKEPALTILREEAEALLNPPPPMPKVKPGKSKAGAVAKPAK
jgi:hypothetical protein